MLFTSALYIDNVLYGKGGEVKTHVNMETSMYEVPVSLAAENGNTTEHEYEFTGSTYATPHVYEYATLGPNKETV